MKLVMLYHIGLFVDVYQVPIYQEEQLRKFPCLEKLIWKRGKTLLQHIKIFAHHKSKKSVEIYFGTTKQKLVGNCNSTVRRRKCTLLRKFQQDNDAKRLFNLGKTRFLDHILNVIEWPSHTLDLNPVENVCGGLKEKYSQQRPLISSMPTNIEDVLRNDEFISTKMITFKDNIFFYF